MNDLESTIFNMSINEMMLNIDMFGALLVAGILQEVNHTAIVNEHCS
jgi:hypothetical protein